MNKRLLGTFRNSEYLITSMRGAFLLISMTTASAFAGGGGMDSGGGTAVVCRDSNNAITKATLLDLFEAESGGLVLKNASGSLRTDFEALNAEFTKSRNNKRIGYEGFDLLGATLRDFKFEIGPLPLLGDVGAMPQDLPAGCKLEQLAIASDQPAKFRIDIDIWNHLNSLNQAALVFHEVIYWQPRLIGVETTSWRTRAIVGTAATVTGLENMYEGAPGEATICRGVTAPASLIDTYFLIYDNPVNPKFSTLLITQYFGIVPYYRIHFKIPKFDAKSLVPAASGSGLVVEDPNAPSEDFIYRGSFTLLDQIIGIRYRKGQLFSVARLDDKQNVLGVTDFVECKPWTGIAPL